MQVDVQQKAEFCQSQNIFCESNQFNLKVFLCEQKNVKKQKDHKVRKKLLDQISCWRMNSSRSQLKHFKGQVESQGLSSYRVGCDWAVHDSLNFCSR